MSESRNRILERLRRNQPDIPLSREPLEVPRAEPLDLQQRIDSFTARMQAVRAEVHRCGSSDWPATLEQLLREKQCPNLLFAPRGPLGEALSAHWQNHSELPPLVELEGEIEQWKENIFSDTGAVITSARAGIADIGSLVLWPGPDEPRSYSLVPPVHFVVLESTRLHANFAELVERERWSDGLPTNALLISGPSKTADIEQTLAYGIHGPVELVVLLID